MCAKRLVKIKVASENYLKVMNKLAGKEVKDDGIVEETIQVEDTAETYKYLSTSEDIIEWETVEEKKPTYRTFPSNVPLGPGYNPLRKGINNSANLGSIKSTFTTDMENVSKYLLGNVETAEQYCIFLNRIHEFMKKAAPESFRFTVGVIHRNILPMPFNLTDTEKKMYTGFLEGYMGLCNGKEEFAQYVATNVGRNWKKLWNEAPTFKEFIEVIFDTKLSPTPIV